jgi:hypothetical protein
MAGQLSRHLCFNSNVPNFWLSRSKILTAEIAERMRRALRKKSQWGKRMLKRQAFARFISAISAVKLFAKKTGGPLSARQSL